MQKNITDRNDADESPATEVAWPAVIAGAFVATAVSLSLLFLGGTFGFASLSPWHHSPSAVTFTAFGAIWLIIMQWVSSAIGGFITGRMRTQWAQIHTDEVFFRDTANGFITWAVATVATAILVGSVFASALGGAAHMAEKMPPPPMGPSVAGPGPDGVPPQVYYIIDRMFRSPHPSAAPHEWGADMEATRIFMNSLRHEGDVPSEDRDYLTQLVASHAGVNPAEAHRRVDAAIEELGTAEEKVKEAANAARKTAATVSIFTFLSLLVGAFIACVGAAVGGRERDLH